MDKKQIHKLNFIRKVNLSNLIFESLEDRGSLFVEFVSSFTLNFILNSLESSKRKEFSQLLESKSDSHDLWLFAVKNIENFPIAYEKNLENKLRDIQDQVLNRQLV